MVTLKETLQNDLADSMRARDAGTTSALRMVLAAIMNAEVAGKEAITLTDAQVVDVLRSEAKKRAESAEIYATAGRAEAADKERSEITVIERYLPARMSDDDLEAVVRSAVDSAAAAGQTGPKAMGAVIKLVKEQVGSSVDGGRVASVVKAMLA